MKQFLELPNGILSHDTFARVFSQLKPEQFQECFLSWIKSIARLNEGEVIAIDGKTLWDDEYLAKILALSVN